MLKDLRLEGKFFQIKAELEHFESLDVFTSGYSPATFRYLTKSNKYILMGLEQRFDEPVDALSNKVEYCLVLPNNNSTYTTDEDTNECLLAIKGFLDERKAKKLTEETKATEVERRQEEIDEEAKNRPDKPKE